MQIYYKIGQGSLQLINNAMLQRIFDEGYGIRSAGFIDHTLPVPFYCSLAGVKFISYLLVSVTFGG